MGKVKYIYRYTRTSNYLVLLNHMIEMRKFADSNNSTYIIPKWIDYFNVNISQYIVPVNGYQSWN